MTATSARSEALLVSAAVLAGALAGVIVQAAIEVGRGRREDREQLRAAGAVLDAADQEREQLREQLQAENDLRVRWQNRASAAEVALADRARATRDAAVALQAGLAPCLCGADGHEGDGGPHESNCPRWEPPPAPEVPA